VDGQVSSTEGRDIAATGALSSSTVPLQCDLAAFLTWSWPEPVSSLWTWYRTCFGAAQEHLLMACLLPFAEVQPSLSVREVRRSKAHRRGTCLQFKEANMV
jgi:hypothetical protein